MTGRDSETHARPDDDDTITVGTMIGEYAVDGVLGQGGMGKVYAATHPIIAKRAAVKVLHPALSMDREAVERFVQEARSVNQIGHPNIVDIFAFGSLPDGRSYFVMEYLRGQSLRERLRKEPLKLVEALALLDTISQALEAAHETGIVHRDLKPDNIFLVELKGAPPQVKLLDFGIAKLLGTDTVLTERTRTGNMLGTPMYISPEQARGYAVDHRTDIYAFGCVAFELVTGNVPFQSDNAADMIAQHLYGAVPSAGPDVPPELDALLTAMMAKDAAARPSLATAREVLRRVSSRFSYAANMLLTAPSSAVAPMLTPMPPRAPAVLPPMPTRSPVLVIGIVATLVVAIGVTMFVLVRQSIEPTAAPAKQLAPAPPVKQMAVDVEKPVAPAPPAPVLPVAPVPTQPSVVPAPAPPAIVDDPPLPKPDLNAAAKALGERHTKKPFHVGPRPTAPATTRPAASPDDDDAPMRR